MAATKFGVDRMHDDIVGLVGCFTKELRLGTVVSINRVVHDTSKRLRRFGQRYPLGTRNASASEVKATGPFDIERRRLKIIKNAAARIYRSQHRRADVGTHQAGQIIGDKDAAVDRLLHTDQHLLDGAID